MAAPEPSSLQVAARRYTDLGLCVIPLKAMSKTPDLSRWQQYQGRRSTEKEIESWFAIPRNLGIVCGSVSGGLVVVDFDDPRAFPFCFAKSPIGSTPIARTGKGLHLYARIRGGGKPRGTTFQRKGDAKVWIPVDVKGEGGYVVAPPSVHPSGKAYEWVGEFGSVLEVDYDALVAGLKERSQEWPFFVELAPSWATPGARHNLALGVAAFAAKKLRWPEGRTKAFVERVCAALEDPEPLDRLRGVETTYANLAAGKDIAYVQYLGAEISGALELLAPRRLRPATPKEGGAAAHAEHVDRLMEKFAFATTSDTGEVYAYDCGVYRSGAEALIRANVELAFLEDQDSAKKTLADEVVDAIRRRTYVKRAELNPAGKLCLLNGVLQLDALSFGPHTRNDRFTRQLPVSFDSAATCPTWVRVLETILPDPRHRELVQRMFGYCLEAGNPYQVAFMAYGPGNNGKSTLLGILGDLLGKDNIATETLQTLSENRFAAGRLWDKLANVCADIPASMVRYTGTFKELSGGDWMRGEEKFRAAFNFINPAKLVFSANLLPEVNDRTVAFWRRWVLIPFVVDLTGQEDRALPEKLRAELPGILNWSLEGLRKLRAARSFEANAAADSLMEEWKRRSDPLYWFLSECIRDDPQATVTKDEFYSRYGLFCQEHNVKASTRNQVGERLRELRPAVKQERPHVGERREWVWSGLTWNEEASAYEPNKEPSGPSGQSGPGGHQTGLGEAPGPDGPNGQDVSILGSENGAPSPTAHHDMPPGPQIEGPFQPGAPCVKCGKIGAWRVSMPGETWLNAYCDSHLHELGLSPPEGFA